MSATTITLEADGVRVLLRGLEPEFAERIFREYLEGRGWLVQQPHDWERPRDFCQRIGIEPYLLTRKLQDRNRPPVALDRGPRGRLRALAATPAFEAFCRRNL